MVYQMFQHKKTGNAYRNGISRHLIGWSKTTKTAIVRMIHSVAFVPRNKSVVESAVFDCFDITAKNLG